MPTIVRPGERLLLFDANWNMPLYDEDMARRAEDRRQECLRQYGDALETADEVTEPFDPLQLPLSGTKRPYWDVELLRSMGFGEVHAEFNLTERLWDEKERLLYWETPMFGVFATKF